ncbi:MAG: amicyanin [Gammaproteobacteria bacterium]|nr:amicyanin [Gammaproteobacteria bacterium]
MFINRQQLIATILTLVGLVAILLIPNHGVAEGVGQTHIIEIRDLNFFPAEIKVNPGDTVRWVNKDFVPHTATANNRNWDSRLIGINNQWELVINGDTIEDYYCIYHPNMKGVISLNK